ATSGAVFFQAPSLPRSVTLRYDIPAGVVKLLFSGKGEHLAELHARCGHRLEPGMRLERAAKSAAVCVDVERIDMRADFSSAEHKVIASLQAASSLLTWYAQVFGTAGAT